MVIVVLAFLYSIASAGERPQPLPGQQQDVEYALMQCPTSMERYLPGEYYFCEAGRHFWLGQQGQAMASWRDAAAWASKPAQYALGVSYFNGQRVPQDRALGLAWLALASERHDLRFEPAFVSAYRLATDAERDRANVLWLQMRKVYGDEVAARRAKLRFDRAVQPLANTAFYDGDFYLSGFTMGNLGTSDNPARASAIGVNRRLQGMAGNYFYGWKENVTVGELQLVPLSSALKPMK